MIPKIIHQIWIGDKPRPDKWMRTWQEKHPNWKHIVWNEEMIRELPLKNEALFNKYKEMDKPHGMADVARAEILYRCGGIYIDADCECLETFEGADFMESEFFSAYANEEPKLVGRITNSIIGSVKNHPLLKRYIEKMGVAEIIIPPWNTIGGTLFTECINDFGIGKVKILPPHYFYPENKNRTKKYSGSDKVYARHYWAQTKKLY